MTLRTAFTDLFSIEHPIALAPMGGFAGGALAAAVSEGGGLGLVGGGRAHPDWLDRELAIVAGRTTKPWGVGFLCWAAEVSAVRQALSRQPSAVLLSFGDPAPFVQPVRDAGARLIIQVTDLDEARQAVDLGADVIVAQGTDAGGHGGRAGRSTFSFVPVVADLAAPAPVLAAGGIADGRGLAAALALGATGALIGTRFRRRSRRSPTAPSVPRSSRAPALTPNAARSSTSPAALPGLPGTRPGRCAIRSLRAGTGGRRSSQPTTTLSARTAKGSRVASCRAIRSGPARPSISSVTSGRPPASSAILPPRLPRR